MISKELLSLVLGEEIHLIVNTNFSILNYRTQEDKQHIAELNIDTLCRLCKEWCLEQGFTIRTEPIRDEDLDYWVVGAIEYTDDAEYLRFSSLDTDTELKAVVLATEFIANEKGLL